MSQLRRSVFIVSCFLGCSLSIPAVSGQQIAPANASSSAQESPVRSPVDRRIVLDVVVTDKSGQHIHGLQQQDFTILDNKAPVKVTGFEAVEASADPTATKADPPGQTILLLDEVNTTFTQTSRARDEVERFLRRNEGKLAQPTALAFLSDSGVEMLNEPTSNGNALIGSLQAHDAALRDIRRSAGFYGAVERFQLSLRSLEEITEHEANTPGKKTLIWISPGWPILSGPNIDLSSRQEEALFNTLKGLTEALQHARITICSVDPLGTADAGGLRTFYYQNFLKGVDSPRQMQAGNLALQVFAVHSGGLALSGSNDVASEIAASVADEASWYILSFDAPEGDPPGRYHAIQVQIGKPNLKVRTSGGYYAQP